MKKQKFLRKSLSAAVVFAMAAQGTLPFGLCAKADSVKATEFTFSDGQITVSEGSYNGYEVEGTSLSIKKSGTYQVSGTCEDGNIKIKKGTEDVVLILDGLTLTSADTAPICCAKSSSVSILANAGTVNCLTDASYNNDDNYPDNANAENAVIKCKDGSNVTIGGSGTLNLTANGKNGIKSGASTDTEGDASLTIEDITLQITASVNDAVNAESLLTVKSGNLDISAADDALHSDYNLIIGEKDSDQGPDITIHSCYEGLEGADVMVYSGDIEIHSTDDGINAANSDLTGYAFSLEIAGGEIYVDAAEGDGIDSNGTLTISGGKTEVFSTSSGDNAPLDSDGTFSITGGTVFAVGNSGMAQTPASGSQGYVAFGASQFGGGPGGNGGFGGGFGGPGGMGGGPGGRPGGRSSQQTEAASQNSNGNAVQKAASGISIAAGDTLSVTDGSSKELYTAAAVRSANYVLYSDSALSADTTYTLNINGTAAAEAAVNGNASQNPGDPSGGGNVPPQNPPSVQEPGTSPEEPAPDQKPELPPQNPPSGQEPGVTPEEPEPDQKPELPPENPPSGQEPGVTPDEPAPDQKPELPPENPPSDQEPGTSPEEPADSDLDQDNSDSASGNGSNTNTAEDISKSAKVTLGKISYVYDGRKKKPSVTVRAGSKKLAKNTDYTVSYKNNTKVGTASVVITGKGAYTGTLTKRFTIVPKGTSISGKVQAKSGGFLVKWKKQTKSVTGYEIQYSTARKFTEGKTVTKKIRKMAATKYTVKKLKAKTKYYIRIRTYKTVNGKTYASAWSKTKAVTTKG